MDKNYSLTEIEIIAQEIINSAEGKILLFYGEMGVGKTTLIKEICKQLGVSDIANSPTFSIVNEYLGDNNQIIYHFDFYRIEDENEVLDMGIEDYLYSNNWCLIEWPENISNLLPLNSKPIHLTVTEDGRRSIQLN